MKWTVLAASAVITTGLWLPGQAAQPATPNETPTDGPPGTDPPKPAQ